MSTQIAEPPPMVPEDSIANRLILARAMAGHISIRVAAMRCGLGRGAWQNWERGISEPRLSDLHRVATGLNVRFGWLTEGGPLADPKRHGGAATGRYSSAIRHLRLVPAAAA